MIITRQKSFDEILRLIKNDPVFIVGCSECATICHTGGEEEVLSIKEDLKKKNIRTTGWVVLDPACHLQNDKRLLKKHQDEINKAKKVLVLACGNGIQTVAEIVNNADVISGTDTLFLGEIKRLKEFEKRCMLCGECLLDVFEGLCPVARCPKSMLNGPCGGAINGKCEIEDIDCVWELIYSRLKEKGELHQLKELQPPKDWAKSTETRRTL
jgi:ferredoxin